MTKKIIMIALSATAMILTGCYKIETDKDFDEAWTDHGRSRYTKVVEIQGHKYIIMDGPYSGNITHAASCECMNK